MTHFQSELKLHIPFNGKNKHKFGNHYFNLTWTGLYKTSNQPHGFFSGLASGYLEVLTNDNLTNTPQYLASQNLTVVQMNVFNAQSKFNFYFTGDQNYSGNYKYFINTGNV